MQPRPPGQIMSRPKVLFWDFDGTLAIRHGGWSGAILEALAEHEPDPGISREEIRPYLQAGFPWQTPEKPHPHLSDPDLWWAEMTGLFARALTGVGLEASRAQSLARQVRLHYLDGASWSRYEDTIPALRSLSSLGWTHVIVSNHVPELSDIVSQLGMSRYFGQVINSAVVGYEKPHPRIFERALEAVGGAQRVWMVGDSYEADVLGAEGVGVRGILVRNHHPAARYFSEGLDGVESLVENVQ